MLVIVACVFNFTTAEGQTEASLGSFAHPLYQRWAASSVTARLHINKQDEVVEKDTSCGPPSSRCACIHMQLYACVHTERRKGLLSPKLRYTVCFKTLLHSTHPLTLSEKRVWSSQLLISIMLMRWHHLLWIAYENFLTTLHYFRLTNLWLVKWDKIVQQIKNTDRTKAFETWLWTCQSVVTNVILYPGNCHDGLHLYFM